MRARLVWQPTNTTEPVTMQVHVTPTELAILRAVVARSAEELGDSVTVIKTVGSDGRTVADRTYRLRLLQSITPIFKTPRRPREKKNDE